MRNAIMAEFGTADALVAALGALRDRGYRRMEAYTPFPLHEVDHYLGHARSRLPFAICAGAAVGASAAYGLQWLLNAHLYPLNVGGRPPHFPLAYGIITFEMGVLAAALTAFVGVLVLGKLLRLWRPEFEVEGFERATDDRYWMAIAADDPAFSEADTPAHLRELSPLQLARIDDGRVMWQDA